MKKQKPKHTGKHKKSHYREVDKFISYVDAVYGTNGYLEETCDVSTKQLRAYLNGKDQDEYAHKRCVEFFDALNKERSAMAIEAEQEAASLELEKEIA